MVKREVVLSRINKLNEYIDILKSVLRYNKNEYINDLLYTDPLRDFFT